MAAATKKCFLRFLGDFCTELSLHRSVIQNPRFTNDYKFGISDITSRQSNLNFAHSFVIY